jgi:predicted RNase H-like HicB family nuclease
MKQSVIVRAEVFREGDLYVGVCPELDASSFGETVEEARRSLREALGASLEEREAMGTLVEVLEEAGFARQDSSWLPRQPVAAELVTVN